MLFSIIMSVVVMVIMMLLSIIIIIKFNIDGEIVTLLSFVLIILAVLLFSNNTCLIRDMTTIRQNMAYYYKYHSEFEKKKLEDLSQKEKDAISEYNKTDWTNIINK